MGDWSNTFLPTGVGQTLESLAAENAALKAENARLREVLRKVSMCPLGNATDYYVSGTVMDRVAAALKGELA